MRCNCKTCAVIGIGLIEVREHRVLVRIVGHVIEVTGQRRHEVLLVLLGQRAVILARLPGNDIDSCVNIEYKMT